MAQVSVVVNGRLYQLDCEDGGQDRLRDLSAHLNQKIETLKRSYPNEADEQLLIIASLTITDEFFDTREALANALSQLSQRTEETAQLDG